MALADAPRKLVRPDHVTLEMGVRGLLAARAFGTMHPRFLDALDYVESLYREIALANSLFNDSKDYDIKHRRSRYDTKTFADALEHGDWEKLSTWEIKTERVKWESSRRLFLQTGTDRKPSGLLTSTADMFVQGVARDLEHLCWPVWPRRPLLRQVEARIAAGEEIHNAGRNGRYSGVWVDLAALLFPDNSYD
jgi:hypothetical protein